MQEINRVKHLLDHKFKIKDLGALRFFLGFKIYRSDTCIFFNKRKYTLQLLEDTCFLAAKSSFAPFDPTLKLSTMDGEPSIYIILIVRLIYLTNSRPDISYVVQHLSQYVSQPRVPHYQADTRIPRYLKACPAKGIIFSSSSALKSCGFADSDWARYSETQKSITDFCVMFVSSLLCWKFKK